jgi:hypothetical protein
VSYESGGDWATGTFVSGTTWGDRGDRELLAESHGVAISRLLALGANMEPADVYAGVAVESRR